MDYETSERLMLASESLHVAELAAKVGDGLNPEVLAVMSSLFRSGWRECWAAGILERLNEVGE